MTLKDKVLRTLDNYNIKYDTSLIKKLEKLEEEGYVYREEDSEIELRKSTWISMLMSGVERWEILLGEASVRLVKKEEDIIFYGEVYRIKPKTKILLIKYELIYCNHIGRCARGCSSIKILFVVFRESANPR